MVDSKKHKSCRDVTATIMTSTTLQCLLLFYPNVQLTVSNLVSPVQYMSDLPNVKYTGPGGDIITRQLCNTEHLNPYIWVKKHCIHINLNQ